MGTKISYTTELNAMYSYFLEKSPGKAAVAMLQALYMAERSGKHGDEWFEVDCDCLSRLMGGYSREAISQARNKLRRMGRIEYVPGDRNAKKPSYKIIPLSNAIPDSCVK